MFIYVQFVFFWHFRRHEPPGMTFMDGWVCFLDRHYNNMKSPDILFLITPILLDDKEEWKME